MFARCNLIGWRCAANREHTDLVSCFRFHYNWYLEGRPRWRPRRRGRMIWCPGTEDGPLILTLLSFICSTSSPAVISNPPCQTLKTSNQFRHRGHPLSFVLEMPFRSTDLVWFLSSSTANAFLYYERRLSAPRLRCHKPSEGPLKSVTTAHADEVGRLERKSSVLML